MRVIHDKPPNFENIQRVFPIILTKKNILYCWDDMIYSPDVFEIPVELLKHEECHSYQQKGNPDWWWDTYLKDKTFRFEQELAAHRIEYQRFMKDHQDRNLVFRYLHVTALRLSGPLYGCVVAYRDALKLLKE